MDKRISVKMLYFFYALIVFSCQSEKKQTIEIKGMASFYADLRLFEEHDPKLTKAQEQAEWLIHGKKLKWGSTPIYVLPDSTTLDTIYFRQEPNGKWDTILCNIKEAKKHFFCATEPGYYFAVAEKNRNVKFEIEQPTKRQFLGKYGGCGILAKHKKVAILKDDCLGFVSSNINNVELFDIEISQDRIENTDDLIGFYENTDNLAKENLYFKTKKKLLEFKYMQLNDETVTVGYNPKTDKITIKIQ